MQISHAQAGTANAGNVIPVVETQTHLAQLIQSHMVQTVLLRHCNLFDISALLLRAHQRSISIYVNIDQIDGIHTDADGLDYLVKQCHISGIVSSNPHVLALGKRYGLKTIQRVFAVDSTGLAMSLESVDAQAVDLLDISPALVVPYLTNTFPLPFIASGLIYTPHQIQAVLRAGAQGVAVSLPELWP